MPKGDKKRSAQIRADLAEWVQQFRDGHEDPVFTNLLVDASEAVLTGEAKSLDHALGLVTRGTNTPVSEQAEAEQIRAALDILVARFAGQTWNSITEDFEKKECGKKADKVSEKQLKRILERFRASAIAILAERATEYLEQQDASDLEKRKSEAKAIHQLLLGRPWEDLEREAREGDARRKEKPAGR
jgi:hypothetical protein